MDLTLFLSQVIGVYLFVGSLSALLYPRRVKHAAEEISRSYILLYFDGALALIVGLIIVLLHNVWVGLPATIVTLVGWLAVLEGFLMMLLPQASIRKLMDGLMTPPLAKTFGVVGLVAGAYLVYVGFFM